MEELSNKMCIVIASHLSKKDRISYLMECLDSLDSQTLPVSIYLSISFENDTIKAELMDTLKEKNYNKLNLRVKENKTPQMRHILLLLKELEEKHRWVMFCDDDDIYEKNRVEMITKNIYYGEIECQNAHKKKLAGLYESTFGKDHREHRHEYWCYCVNIEVLKRFYNRLENYPDIVDNKCCDVLFAEYLRRICSDYLYCRIQEKLYNYRVDDNTDSITGVIRGNQQKFTRLNTPPPIGDPAFSDYVLDWDDFLRENIEVYIHDVFLRTIVGCNLDYILRAEFRAEYELMQFVDQDVPNKIKAKYEYWHNVCNKLYDIPFS